MYWLYPKINPNIPQLNDNQLSKTFDEIYSIPSQPIIEENLTSDKSQLLESTICGRSTFVKSNIFNIPHEYLFYSFVGGGPLQDFKYKRNQSAFLFNLVLLFQLLTLLLSIIAFIITAYETNEFYRVNKFSILLGKIIINNIKTNPNNHTWNDIVHSTQYNLSQMLFPKKLNGKVVLSNYYRHFIHENNNGYIDSIENEDVLFAYNASNEDFNYYLSSSIKDIKMKIKSCDKINNARKVIALVSFFSIIFSFFVYYLGFHANRRFFYEMRVIFKTPFFYHFCIEFIIFILFPYPLLTGNKSTYKSNIEHYCPNMGYLSMFVYFRLFFFIKLMRLTKWNSELVIQKCYENKIKHGWKFILNCYLYEHPYIFFVCSLILIYFTFGFSIQILEMYHTIGETEQNQFWESKFNVAHFIFFTIFTIGEKGQPPRSLLGKLLYSIVLVISVFQITIIIMICLFRESIPSTYLNTIYLLIKVLENKNKIKNEQAFMIYYALLKKKKKIKNNINMISNLNKETVRYQTCCQYHKLMTIIEHQKKDFKIINLELLKLSKINYTLSEVIKNQKELIKNLRETIISLVILYKTVDLNRNKFGQLGKVNKNILFEEMIQKYFYDNKHHQLSSQKIKQNDNTSISNFLFKESQISSSSFVVDDINNYNISEQEMILFFQNLFFEDINSINQGVK